MVVGALLAVSCNLNPLPEFDDANAFVAFDKTEMMFNETDGVVKIPVTLASVQGISTQVKFESSDSTAKVGVDFKINGESTLTFDADKRTDFIELEIIPNIGTFTGDKVFKLTLTDFGAVKPGYESSCIIKIQDEDHPLASILGTYALTGGSAFGGPLAFDITFVKDPDDIHVVWVKNIIPGFPGTFTGKATLNENNEVTTVTMPCGQVCPDYKSPGNFPPDGEVLLFSYNAEADEVDDKGEITISFTNNGANFEIKDLGYGVGGFKAPGQPAFFEIVLPGATGVKK